MDAYSLQTDRSTDSLVSFADRVLRDGDLDGDLASIEEKEQIKQLRGEMQKLQDQLREKKSELVTVVSPLKPKKPAGEEKVKDEHSEAGSRRPKRRAKLTSATASSGERPPVKEQTTTATSMDTPRSKSWYQKTEKVSTRHANGPKNPTGLELFLIGVCLVSVSVLCATTVPSLLRSAALNAGTVLQVAGNADEAEMMFRMAVWFDPDRRTQLQLADALRAQGRVGEAIPLLENLLAEGSAPFKQAHVRLGLCLLTMPAANITTEGNATNPHLEAAIHQFRQALEMDGEMAEAHLYLGVALQRGGHMEEAAHHLRHSLQVDPNNTEAHWQLAVVLHANHQCKEALPHYKTVLAASHVFILGSAHSQVHYRTALCMLEAYQIGAQSDAGPGLLGNPGTAMGTVGAMIAQPPDGTAAPSAADKAAADVTGDECATEDALRTTQREDGTIGLAGDGGEIPEGREANDTVVSYEQEVLYQLEEAVRLDGDFAEARIQLAMFLSYLQQFEASAAHGRALLEQSPRDTAVHWALAVALHGAGNCEEALEHYRALLAEEPDHRNAHFRAGICLQELRHLSEAIAHYQEVLRVDPGYAQAHVNWGMALKALHKRPQAIEHYKMALDLDATCADAHVRWGNVLLEQWMEHRRSTDSGNNFWNEAILHFKKALHLDPNYAGLAARLDSLLDTKREDAEDRDPYHQQQQQQAQQAQQQEGRVKGKRTNTRRDSRHQ